MSNDNSNNFMPTIDDLDRSRRLHSGPKYYLRFKQLFVAAERCENDTVLECLNSGIPINSYDRTGRTVFHIAAGNGNLDLIEMIINWPQRDIDVRTLDFQLTPLHEAVLCERVDIVAVFLQNGAKLNLVNGHGETVVHLAVKLNAIVILKLLMSYKANLNVVDVFSNTPLSLAILNTRNQYICGLLLRRGARVNKNRPQALYLFHETILHCIGKQDVWFVKLLVRYGAFINYVDTDGRNALHYAAIAGIGGVVRYLIQIGVKATLRDTTLRTPYDIAFEHGHNRVTDMLAEYLQVITSPKK